MNKYKVGDKIVLTVSDVNEKAYYSYYVFNNNDLILWEPSTDKYAEPLSTYTEPLEAKIRRQAAEITRLLAENKELKEDFEKSKRVNLNMGRRAGQNEAWEMARKIAVIPKDGGYGGSKLIEIFNTALIDEIFNLTYQEAAAKVAEWEKAKEEIKVGDVFEFTSGGKAVVMKVYEDGEVALFFPDGGCGIYEPGESWHKTGRHIDIDSFLKQIGGNGNER